MNITLLADRVIVEVDHAEEKTTSGIIIPESSRQNTFKGTVRAVGSGKKDEPMIVKVDDKVLYGKHAGSQIIVEGKEYLLMRESDILVVIEDGKI